MDTTRLVTRQSIRITLSARHQHHHMGFNRPERCCHGGQPHRGWCMTRFPPPRPDHLCFSLKTALNRKNPMPNGRTGGFAVTRSDLEHLLKGIPSDVLVGISGGSRNARRVSVSEISGMLETHPVDKVGIEDQDHGSWFIIHLENNFDVSENHLERMVSVFQDSPLHELLKQLQSSKSEDSWSV